MFVNVKMLLSDSDIQSNIAAVTLVVIKIVLFIATFFCSLQELKKQMEKSWKEYDIKM